MTLPVERTRAVLYVNEMGMLLHNAYYSPKRKFVHIPAEQWERFMRHLTRHYPTSYDLEVSAEKCPEIWGDL